MQLNNEVLYLILPQFAAHEMVYLAQGIASDCFAMRANPKFVNKILAPTLDPVSATGGYRVIPDYSFADCPEDYAALILVGGFGWSCPVADGAAPIIAEAIASGKPVGAICNAVSFMAKKGFLNDVAHTGNGLDQLKLWGKDNYANENMYRNQPAVSEGNIITANGSAALEFAREMLLRLNADTPESIAKYYNFNKNGF